MPSYKLIKITKPGKLTWQISLDAPPDNRLTDQMLNELGRALDDIEHDWRSNAGDWSKDNNPKRTGGAVILTSAIQKFFSNGLDYENSIKNPNFHPETFSPLYIRLLTFPLVTIAAINGHAFAGGFLLALACDFRLMTDGRAWCCMNEIAFGAPFPPLFAAALSYFFPPPQLLTLSLGHRFTASELLASHHLHSICPASSLVSTALELGEKEGAKVGGGTWGTMKEHLYEGILEAGRKGEMPLMPSRAAERFFREKRPAGGGDDNAVSAKL